MSIETDGRPAGCYTFKSTPVKLVSLNNLYTNLIINTGWNRLVLEVNGMFCNKLVPSRGLWDKLPIASSRMEE